jgi:hypothetical protein
MSNSKRTITRRGFAGATASALTLGTLPAQTETTVVDQNPIRRRGVGFRALNPAKASPGLTLFPHSAAQGGAVSLIDLRGKIEHTWTLPYLIHYGYLTEKGTLFCNGKIPNNTPLGKTGSHCGVVLEADWNGKVLWEVRQPDHHNDGRLLPNGNVLLVCATALPDAVAEKVRGGRVEPGENAKMEGDYLVEMTQHGRTVWQWNSWEHLDPAIDVITAIQDDRAEWTHANGIHELPDDHVLLSFRNTSVVINVDRKSGKIVWRLGAPPLSGQHAPTPLANGNILIFDNGPHRLDESLNFSRVIEVQPATKKIVWKYQSPVVTGFFSPRISNAQRLPNGNTLINEGVFGRFFEVTTDGETVWEYVNPYFGPPGDPAAKQQNSTFRAYRYTEEQIQRARRAV